MYNIPLSPFLGVSLSTLLRKNARDRVKDVGHRMRTLDESGCPKRKCRGFAVHVTQRVGACLCGPARRPPTSFSVAFSVGLGAPDNAPHGKDAQQLQRPPRLYSNKMPTSARKSSIGGPRRGVQKYIPYHADDLLRGKRTGIAVGYVDRNSDEFEPFDQVMQQADLRTPPKPKVRNKKRRAPKTPVIEEDDGDGEMSMELEDSENIQLSSSCTKYIFLTSFQAFQTALPPISRTVSQALLPVCSVLALLLDLWRDFRTLTLTRSPHHGLCLLHVAKAQ